MLSSGRTYLSRLRSYPDGPNSLLGIRVGEHAQAPDVPGNSVPENDPPENNETQSVPEQNSEQENASLSGLYDTIMAKVSASSQKNEYKYEN